MTGGRPVHRRCSLTIPVLLVGLVVVMTACAAEADTATDDMIEGEPAHEEAEGETHGEDFAWGAPADAGEATRTIEIEAADDFTFDPADVEVEAGETVTFQVTNVGQLEHDFTLGDTATQEAHAQEMMEMDGMAHGADETNALTIPPGDTGEMTWTFTQPGEILIGCHVAGHYEAGMRGALTITDGS